MNCNKMNCLTAIEFWEAPLSESEITAHSPSSFRLCLINYPIVICWETVNNEFNIRFLIFKPA